MILLKNATYLNDSDLSLQECDLLVKAGEALQILAAGSNHEADRVIDCSGRLVMKSFACGHHHAYSALSRGMGAPKKVPANFPEILQYVWWTLDKCLDDEMVEVSAMVTAIACARNGVTFVIDHHASPFAIPGSLSRMAAAFEKVGVSHLLCYEISDRDGLDVAAQGLAETEDYLGKHQGLVGLHAGFTVGEETLKSAVDLARRTSSGIHVHCAEDISDQEYSLQHYGKRVVERFSEAGVLDFSKTILAHGIHLDSHERQLVRNSKAWVVHNTESNQNNGVGCFTSEGLGDRLMLGTDGMHSDMLRSAKAAFFGAPKTDALDFPGIYRRFRNVHLYIAGNQFCGDGRDNLVVLKYPSPTPLTANNFLGHFVFGIESSHVEHVISNGELIVENRCILRVDEQEVLDRARTLAERLWKKMQA
jgi:cytosine/adenosine deaminase-related metal-dependent hydrolase